MKLWPPFLLVVLLLLNGSVFGAPKADLWSFWDTADPSSTTVVAHQKWQQILDQYLTHTTADGINRFAYAEVDQSDKALLESYLKELAQIDPRGLNKPEQFAYWVNLYNALTVNLVIDKYPVSSIRKIRFWGSFFGPWDKNLIEVAGKSLSLNDIEHRILRPIWQDPRIHFAVNCASIGCPNLLPQAFTANQSEQMLEQAARAFINHPRAVSRQGKVLRLSSIFDWYQIDFGDGSDDVKAYLRRYLSEQNSESLNGQLQVEYAYDWSLNEKK